MNLRILFIFNYLNPMKWNVTKLAVAYENRVNRCLVDDNKFNWTLSQLSKLYCALALLYLLVTFTSEFLNNKLQEINLYIMQWDNIIPNYNVPFLKHLIKIKMVCFWIIKLETKGEITVIKYVALVTL